MANQFRFTIKRWTALTPTKVIVHFRLLGYGRRRELSKLELLQCEKSENGLKVINGLNLMSGQRVVAFLAKNQEGSWIEYV